MSRQPAECSKVDATYCRMLARIQSSCHLCLHQAMAVTHLNLVISLSGPVPVKKPHHTCSFCPVTLTLPLPRLQAIENQALARAAASAGRPLERPAPSPEEDERTRILDEDELLDLFQAEAMEAVAAACKHDDRRCFACRLKHWFLLLFMLLTPTKVLAQD